MKLKKSQLIISIAIILILICISNIVIPFDNLKRNNFLVQVTFCLNGFVWTALLINEVKKRAFSLSFMHWMFCLLFFFFAAFVQYANDTFPWINYRSDDVLLYANVILLLWTIGVLLGQHVRIFKFSSIKNNLIKEVDVSKCFKSSFIILILIAAWRIFNIGFWNLLARSTSAYAMSENSSIAMLLQHSMDAIAYFSALFCILSIKSSKKSMIYLIVTFIVLLIAYPPTGLARYKAAAIFLGIFLSTSKFLKITRAFVLIFLAGFIVILPFLNAFRVMTFENVSFFQMFNNIMSNMANLWLAGDYDAYTMLTLTIDYIENHGITYGYQFVGALLFWVPRQIWTSKPVGSGAEIAESLGWHFTNLSCPLPAEGLINYSLIGVLFFAILIGILMRFFDKLYWEKPLEINRINIIYPVVVVFFFFVNRGDLLSSTAYMTAFIVVGLVYIKIVSLFNKIRIQ